MNNKLKKIFGDKGSSSSSFDKLEVKSGPAFETEHDVLYGQNCGNFFSRGRNNGNRRGACGGMGARAGFRFWTVRSQGTTDRYPADFHGNTKSSIGESINHWTSACPDGRYFIGAIEEESQNHMVPLFESNFTTDKCIKKLCS